jgi:hypothetical protein
MVGPIYGVSGSSSTQNRNEEEEKEKKVGQNASTGTDNGTPNTTSGSSVKPDSNSNLSTKLPGATHQSPNAPSTQPTSSNPVRANPETSPLGLFNKTTTPRNQQDSTIRNQQDSATQRLSEFYTRLDEQQKKLQKAQQQVKEMMDTQRNSRMTLPGLQEKIDSEKRREIIVNQIAQNIEQEKKSIEESQKALIDRAVQNTNPAELDVSSLGNLDPKKLAELGLSQEELLNRENDRASMSKDEQNARQYQEAVANLFRINQEQIAQLQSRIDLLGKDAINNPNLTPTQRQDLLNEQQKASVEMQELKNAAQQRFQFQNHITDLVEQGKFQDILNLQNGTEKFVPTNIDNQKDPDEILSLEPKITSEQEKLLTQRLMQASQKASKQVQNFSQRLSSAGKDTAEDAKEYTGTWFGADYSTNFFDKHLGEKLTNLAETESTQAQHLSSWSKHLEQSQSQASELIQQGNYKEARELLQKSLTGFTIDLQSAEKQIARERTDPSEWAKVEQNIDASYKAVRNGLLMTGAAIITGGVAVNFMAGGSLLAGGTAGAGNVALSVLAASKATATGAGAMTATGFASEVAGSLLAGESLTDSLAYSASQIPETAKASLLGALGTATGIGLGGKITQALLSKQASSFLQSVTNTTTSGATASLPGIFDDLASKTIDRQRLTQQLRQEGKTQAEIDQELANQNLDFVSISQSVGASFLAGAASGFLSGASARASQGKTIIAKAGIETAEELTDLAIAATETVFGQGIDIESTDFANAMIANLAGLVPSKISGQVAQGVTGGPEQIINPPVRPEDPEQSGNSTPQDPRVGTAEQVTTDGQSGNSTPQPPTISYRQTPQEFLEMNGRIQKIGKLLFRALDSISSNPATRPERPETVLQHETKEKIKETRDLLAEMTNFDELGSAQLKKFCDSMAGFLPDVYTNAGQGSGIKGLIDGVYEPLVRAISQKDSRAYIDKYLSNDQIQDFWSQIKSDFDNISQLLDNKSTYGEFTASWLFDFHNGLNGLTNSFTSLKSAVTDGYLQYMHDKATPRLLDSIANGSPHFIPNQESNRPIQEGEAGVFRQEPFPLISSRQSLSLGISTVKGTLDIQLPWNYDNGRHNNAFMLDENTQNIYLSTNVDLDLNSVLGLLRADTRASRTPVPGRHYVSFSHTDRGYHLQGRFSDLPNNVQEVLANHLIRNTQRLRAGQ